MISDSLSSIFDNIKERTTNPFLGTLIVVWTIKNWKLVYSLFYFDSSLKLDDRLDKITDHFKDQSFLLNMSSVILITLVVLILTYLLLSISRYVTDIYERMVIPKISKWTDKSSVVLKSDYILLEEGIKQLRLRLEEERLAKVAAQSERDQIDTKLTELNSLRTNEETSNEETSNEETSNEETSNEETSNEETSNEETSNEETSNEETSNEPNNGHEEIQKSIDPRFSRVSSNVFNEWGIEAFNLILDKVLAGSSLDVENDIVRGLVRENLIIPISPSGSLREYNFTEKGRDFLDYYNETSHEEKNKRRRVTYTPLS